jgi:hypothetical protein
LKPVHQRYGSDSSKLEFGDCLRACVASVLELSLDDVPHFRWGANEDRPDTVQSMWGHLRMWLRARNIGLLTYDVPCATLLEALKWSRERNGEAYIILGGLGRGGQGHACVVHQGAIVHEPSPNNDGSPSLVGPTPDGEFAGKFVALAFEHRLTMPKDNGGLLGVSTEGVEIPPAPDFSILDRHERIGLCFSGGKDSLVLLDLLRPFCARICVYNVNTQDLLPETLEVVRHAEAMTAGKIGNWCEITTNARGWQEKFGMPSDLVPFNCTDMGRALVNGAAGPIHLVERMKCCGANLGQPLIRKMAADGITLSIRGTRRDDPAWGWLMPMEATGLTRSLTAPRTTGFRFTIGPPHRSSPTCSARAYQSRATTKANIGTVARNARPARPGGTRSAASICASSIRPLPANITTVCHGCSRPSGRRSINCTMRLRI